MKRRAFVLAGLLTSTALSPSFAQQGVTLIYVGGWDCPPCIRWKNARKADWLASREYAKVKYVEIDSPKLKEAYEDRFWPPEYRPIRDQLPRKSGTPRFILVRDGQIVSNEWGQGEWERTQEKIRAVVG